MADAWRNDVRDEEGTEETKASCETDAFGSLLEEHSLTEQDEHAKDPSGIS